MSELDPLLAHAFERAPAAEANAAITRVREKRGERVRSFELVVPPDAGLAWLERELVPRFVYHAESLGIRPPKYPGIFFSLFVGAELLFLDAAEVMAFAAERLGLTHDQMYARWGTGELRGPVNVLEGTTGEKKPVLALPMPPGKDA